MDNHIVCILCVTGIYKDKNDASIRYKYRSVYCILIDLFHVTKNCLHPSLNPRNLIFFEVCTARNTNIKVKR